MQWNGSDAQQKAGSFFGGVMEAPIDLSRYANLGLSWGANKTGLIDDAQAQKNYQTIREGHDKPFFLPDWFNDYRQQLMKSNPGYAAAEEIVAPGLGVAGLAKKGVNLAKNGRGATAVTDILPGLIPKGFSASRAELAGKASIAAAVAEYGKEPIYDKLTK